MTVRESKESALSRSGVWLVCHTDYDEFEILGGFSSQEAAIVYADEMKSHQADDIMNRGGIVIRPLSLDLPRRELRGAWDVEIATDSAEIISKGWWDIKPDELLQVQTNDEVGPQSRRATGLTVEEAVARALTLKVP